MKRYLKKIVLFILPIIIVFTPIELFLRNNSHKAKRDFIQNNTDQIEILVLGPSYSFRAINPEYFDHKAASLAQVGSAINTNILLFKKFESRLEKLKYVFFDLSLGFLERNNSEDWEGSHLLSIYYNIHNYSGEPKNYFLLTANFKYYTKLMASYIMDSDNMELFNEYGFVYKLPKRNDLFKKHGYDEQKLKNSEELIQGLEFQNKINEENYNENSKALHDFIQRCLAKDIEVIFISPPKFHLNNKKILPEMNKRRNEFLQKYTGENHVHFWNYETFLQEEVKLFYDYTHLNPEGAEKFTRMVNHRLLELNRSKQQAKMKSGPN